MVQNSTITNEGKVILLNRGYKSIPDYTPVSKFKIGINQTNDVTVNTTDLDEYIPITNTTLINNCQTTNWTVIDDASAATVNSTAGKYLEGTGCLDLGKSGTSGTSFGYYVVMGSSQSFTTGKKCFCWIYIEDTDDLASSSAVQLRYGSDTTNYYYTSFDRSDLSDGWNALNIDRDSASVEGTPIEGSCDTLQLVFNAPLAADTVTSGDVRMDNWFVTATDSYEQDFDAGYPTFDESNHEVTYRITLATTVAIGFSIDSAIVINTDTSVKKGAVDKFTENSKSKDDSFIFIAKDRLS